ncbi:phosphate propanoyltransferase [Thermosediminibacter litoriperuensis]|uniref:Phosphate propanoyltransferase n=1 Tax=Thermosediminibacter litoriperuensis TaxID=291989 RepID=A0A5S5AV29_9FIRM|nr:phosphate propanoyltransferase [Thermosediminibacter litoriperuensis]TYP55473.1 putative phosphotransacetylase [Thermosediminibacter litoriperuensis]
MLDNLDLQDIVQKVKEKLYSINKFPEVIINVSARHVHLSKEHLEMLFGKNYKLTPLRELMQPGEFASKETVILVGPKGIIQNVRVLGPIRKKTQVEISKTDGFVLGIDPVVRDSGNHEGSSGCILVGPVGGIRIEEGVIAAMRHIHMPTRFAEKYGIKDRSFLKVLVEGERKVVFDKVLARVSDHFVLEMHIDTDEANAAGVRSGDKGFLIL